MNQWKNHLKIIVLVLSLYLLTNCSGELHTLANAKKKTYQPNISDANKTTLAVQTGHIHPVTALVFNSDGTLLLSRGQHVVKLWDIRTGKEIRTFSSKNETQSISISPDNELIASTGGDGVKLWNIKNETSEPIAKFVSEKTIHGSLVKFSPDGRTLAIAVNGGVASSIYGQIKLLDVQREKYIFESNEKSGNVKAIDFSPDGKFFAYFHSGSEYLIIIVDIASKKELSRFSIPMSRNVWPLSIAFSPNNKIIATQDNAKLGYIKFWDIFSGKMLHSINAEKKVYSKSEKTCGQRSYPKTIAFHKNGKMILHGIKTNCSNEEYNEIRLWNIEQQTTVQNFRTNNLTSFALSPSGNIVASGHSSGNIKLWDLKTGRQIKILRGYAQQVTVIDSNPIYPKLASGNFDHTVKIWDFSGENPILQSLTGHEDIVVSLNFHPNGKLLVSSDNFLHNEYWLTFPQNPYSKPDVNKYLNAYLKPRSLKSIKVWNIMDGKAIQSLVRSNNAAGRATYGGDINPRITEVHFPKYVTFSPDGRMIAHGIKRGNVHIFDTQTGKQIHTFFDTSITSKNTKKPNYRKPHIDGIAAFTFHPNGQQLIGDNEIWDIDSEKKVRTIPDFSVDGNTGMLAINRDGSLIAGTCSGGFSARGAICLKDMVGSKKRQKPLQTKNNNHVNTIIFHPKKNILAAGYENGMIILWDADNRKKIRRFSGQDSVPINSLSFNANGDILYSSSFDAQIKLWNVKDGRQLASLIAVNNKDYVIFTPDHYYMATKEGLKGVAFRIGNKTYPFEQFDLKLNRPDIVLQQIGYASKKITDMYYQAYKKRLKRLEIDEKELGYDLHLPEINIISNDIPLFTESSQLNFSIKAYDSKYLLDRINIWVNDVPIYGKKGIDLKPRRTMTEQRIIDLKLSDGLNKIQVSALNRSGAESLKETFQIHRKPASLSSKILLVAIGAGKYHQDDRDLKYAAKDAMDIVKLFTDKTDNILVFEFINDEVNRANILAKKFALNQTNVNDAVIIYYAGHGLLDDDCNYFLATYDTDFNNPSSKGLAYEELEDLFDGIPARNRLLLIDACHSGEVDKDELMKRKNNNNFVENVLSQHSNNDRGRVLNLGKPKLGLENSFKLMRMLFADIRRRTGATVIAAAGGTEYAYEKEQLKNGVFTHCLLTGLKENNADLNDDSRILVSELAKYLHQQVSDMTNDRQQPTFRVQNISNDWEVWR